jgi:hypothetical protein
MPSKPILQACRNTTAPSSSVCKKLAISSPGVPNVSYCARSARSARSISDHGLQLLRLVSFHQQRGQRPGETRLPAPSRDTGATKRVERPVRETKKSPGHAGAFGAQTRWGGGWGGTSFALTNQLDS